MSSVKYRNVQWNSDKRDQRRSLQNVPFAIAPSEQSRSSEFHCILPRSQFSAVPALFPQCFPCSRSSSSRTVLARRPRPSQGEFDVTQRKRVLLFRPRQVHEQPQRHLLLGHGLWKQGRFCSRLVRSGVRTRGWNRGWGGWMVSQMQWMTVDVPS